MELAFQVLLAVELIIERGGVRAIEGVDKFGNAVCL